MTRRKQLATSIFFIFALVLALCFGLQNASAIPIQGQKVYYEGGSIEIKILQSDASYTSNIYLFSTSSPLLIGSSLDVNKVVNLSNLTGLGVAVGDQLVLGIFVNNPRAFKRKILVSSLTVITRSTAAACSRHRRQGAMLLVM